MEYIDKKTLRNALFNGEQNLYSWAEIEATIDALSADDVVHVHHAEWEWLDDEDELVYACSRCGHKAHGNTAEILSGVYKYCPACGAKME